MMLMGIGMMFWAVRLGVLGDLGWIRAWWEGVVGVPPRGAGGQGQEQQPNAGNAAPGAVNQQPVQGAEGGAHQQQPQRGMPTPDQVAQRLLNQTQDERRTWLREQIRPVERAVALFVASLWPGIGEAHVRARREEEERRRAEEEVEARRRAEEEAARTQQQGGEGEKTENARGETGPKPNNKREGAASGDAQSSGGEKVGESSSGST